MWIDLMIDTETAGNGDHGALLSIGAVFFDMQTCALGPTFYRTINLATAVQNGGTIDAGNFIFWMGQSQEARDAVRFSGVSIHSALQDLSDFIAEHSRGQDVRPYGNCSRFDIAKIDNACQAARIKTPWSPFNVRDFRTIRNMYPNVVYDPAQKGKDAHHALGDAIFQARHLFAIKNRNKPRA